MAKRRSGATRADAIVASCATRGVHASTSVWSSALFASRRTSAALDASTVDASGPRSGSSSPRSSSRLFEHRRRLELGRVQSVGSRSASRTARLARSDTAGGRRPRRARVPPARATATAATAAATAVGSIVRRRRRANPPPALPPPSARSPPPPPPPRRRRRRILRMERCRRRSFAAPGSSPPIPGAARRGSARGWHGAFARDDRVRRPRWTRPAAGHFRRRGGRARRRSRASRRARTTNPRRSPRRRRPRRARAWRRRVLRWRRRPVATRSRNRTPWTVRRPPRGCRRPCAAGGASGSCTRRRTPYRTRGSGA